MQESEIINGCINGDRKCQNLFYKKYFPMMSSIALRHCNGNNSDALIYINEAYFKALTNISKYDASFSMATWLRNILIRTIIDHYRKKDKISFESINNLKELKSFKVENLVYEKFEKKELYELLEKVPIASRKIFILYALDGYKHHEIGKMLNISEGTSKWHLNNARKILKLALESLKINEVNG